MTTRLYYTDASLLRFDARIVAMDGRTVYLDRSAFYPTSGGQPHDTGSLGGRRVVDVVDEDDRVAHVLDAPLDAAPGAIVAGTIDAPRRRDHMQQHTGQHLVSALLAEHELDTVSVHFGAETSTIEVAADTVAASVLAAVEERANTIIGEARPVTVQFEDAATVQGLRRPTSRTGEIRIVSIDGVDRSACGGTHAPTTAAIGPVLLGAVERIRGRVRIEFVAGDRALIRARRDRGLLEDAASVFSTNVEELPALVRAQAGRVRELERSLRAAEERLATANARAIYDACAPDASGRRHVTDRRDSATADVLRATATAIAALPNVVYIGTSERPPLVAFAASADTALEAGRTLQAALKTVGGRGGGSPRVAQGTVPDASALAAVVAALS